MPNKNRKGRKGQKAQEKAQARTGGAQAEDDAEESDSVSPSKDPADSPQTGGAEGGAAAPKVPPPEEPTEEQTQTLVDIALHMCKARYVASISTDTGVTTIGKNQDATCLTLGIKEEDRKEANKSLIPRLTQLEAQELVDLMQRLWNEPERDYQYLAIDILTETAISISRNLGFSALFSLMRYFFIEKSGYDTVNWLAKCHLNTLAYLEPPETYPVMDQWVMEHNEPWLQRAVLLHQISMGKYCDKERLFRHCSHFFTMEKRSCGFEVKVSAMILALSNFANTGMEDSLHEVIQFIASNLKNMSPSMQERMKPTLNDLRKKDEVLKEQKKQDQKAKLKEKLDQAKQKR